MMGARPNDLTIFCCRRESRIAFVRRIVRTLVQTFFITTGVGPFGLRVKDLADKLGAKYETSSLWGLPGARRRPEDRAFAVRAETVVAAVASGESTQQTRST